MCVNDSKFFILHSATPRVVFQVFEFLVQSTPSACVYFPLNHSRQSLTLTWRRAITEVMGGGGGGGVGQGTKK